MKLPESTVIEFKSPETYRVEKARLYIPGKGIIVRWHPQQLINDNWKYLTEDEGYDTHLEAEIEICNTAREHNHIAIIQE